MKKIFIVCTLFFFVSQLSAQNIGIGTTNPQAKLHVAGAVRIDTLVGGARHVIYADSNGNLITDNSGLPNINAQPGFIPFPCAAGGITRSITITTLPTAVPSGNVKVRVKINHSFDADLAGYLIAPNGRILNLFYNNGSSGDNFTNTVFGDAAAGFLPAAGAPFTGNYKPTGSSVTTCITPTVTSFAEISGGSIVPNGTWTLKVFDIVSGDDGDLLDWAISFDGTQPSVLNYLQDNYSVRTSGGILTGGSISDIGSGDISIAGNMTASTLTLNSVGVTGDFLIKNNTSTGVGSQKGTGGTGLNYIIATSGIFPSQGGSSGGYSQEILGEIRLFAGNFAPSGFAFCNGQLLQVSTNTALFSLLGTTYGGNGTNNFALPDLRGSVPVHVGLSPAGSDWILGEKH